MLALEGWLDLDVVGEHVLPQAADVLSTLRSGVRGYGTEFAEYVPSTVTIFMCNITT